MFNARRRNFQTGGNLSPDASLPFTKSQAELYVDQKSIDYLTLPTGMKVDVEKSYYDVQLPVAPGC